MQKGDYMAVTIVMGPTCSGKSHLIKERFADAKVIDLYDFQGKGFVTVETTGFPSRSSNGVIPPAYPL